MAVRRVVLTGAEGVVGTVLRRGLGGRFELTTLTRTAQPWPSTVVDVTDLDGLVAAFAGTDAVVHLANVVGLDAPWPDVLRVTIDGTRNVLEAARLTGATRVVLASSGHVIGGAEDEAGPALYGLDDPRTFDEWGPPRPDSPYAVGKVAAEALGRMYSDLWDLGVICVRLGTVLPDDDPATDAPGRGRSATLPLAERYPRIRAKWLSHRDCCGLVERCLESDVRWAVVYGTSDNPRQIWSLAGARALGYSPLDSAPVDPHGARPSRRGGG